MRVLFLLVSMWSAVAFAAEPVPMSPGLHEDIVFDAQTPLATNREILRRMLSPLLAARVGAELVAAGQSPDAQIVDLAGERFAYYVPAGAPPKEGYGLLVFVPPWNEALIPKKWFSVLDRQGVVLVTLKNAGNRANVLGRRVPLALNAYENIRRRFPIDARRTYVGGFSGGSRVALRIVSGYPDVFRGALLNSSTHDFGTAGLPLPEPKLMDTLESDVRLVFATGTRDVENVAIDRHVRDSARALCITDIVTLSMRDLDHTEVDAPTLDRALRELDAPRKADDRTACHAKRASDLDARARQVEAAIDAHEADKAAAELDALDEYFGALAAPRSVELKARVDALHSSATANGDANPMPR